MNIQTAIQLPVGMELFGSNLIGESSIAANFAEWALGSVVVFIFLTSLIFWRKAFSRLKQKQELIPYQRSECVLGFIDVVVIFAVWMGSQIAGGIILLIVTSLNAVKSQSPDEMNAISSGNLFAEHGVLLLYLSAATGIAALLLSGGLLVTRYKTANSFGLRFDQFLKQIGYGVVVFVMMFPVVMLVQWLLTMLVKYDHLVLSTLAENPTFVSIFGCWAAAVLAAPFLEEVLFRGVLHHWLERLSVSKLTNNQLFTGGPDVIELNPIEPHQSNTDNFVIAELAEPNAPPDPALAANDINPYQTLRPPTISPIDHSESDQRRFAYWPILASSSCFALLHLGQGLAPIPLFILAVGLGYLFRQTGSLIACITVHFLLNFYSMLVFTTMVLLGETP